jgi:hypothetical protein
MALGRRGPESGETTAMTAVNRDQEPRRHPAARDPADGAVTGHSLQAAIAQWQKARELLAASALAKLYRATNRDADAHGVLMSAVEGFPPTQQFPELAEAQALLSTPSP